MCSRSTVRLPQLTQPTNASITLILTQRIASDGHRGIGFVKDPRGDKVFTIDDCNMSLSDRRRLLDRCGTVVGQIRHKRTLRELDGSRASGTTFCYIGTATNVKICSVRIKDIDRKLLAVSDRCSAIIFVGGTVIGEVYGNWFEKRLRIRLNDVQVATIFKSLLNDEDSFCIRMEKGIDAAFIVLVAIALDDMFDKNI